MLDPSRLTDAWQTCTWSPLHWGSSRRCGRWLFWLHSQPCVVLEAGCLELPVNCRAYDFCILRRFPDAEVLPGVQRSAVPHSASQFDQVAWDRLLLTLSLHSFPGCSAWSCRKTLQSSAAWCFGARSGCQLTWAR